uniref:Uncharacterized protein n=1 Tax=Lepeophtheirus salmonis TaxID=72036 RepID=A0A0K2TR45_LEPSM
MYCIFFSAVLIHFHKLTLLLFKTVNSTYYELIRCYIGLGQGFVRFRFSGSICTGLSSFSSTISVSVLFYTGSVW